MSADEKALVDAIAKIHKSNPEYANGIIDGINIASKATKADKDTGEKEES